MRAALLLLPFASATQGWSTCGGLSSAYNNTACPATATCCKQQWMPAEGQFGCCPYADATCCANGYTCCPSGTKCSDSGSSWSVVTTCVDSSGGTSKPGAAGGGQQVCKTGGPLQFSTELKNVIVLGDSVSIGYEPKLATHLADVALVQHSPWGGDGGAEETKYGWTCLEFLLAAPDGTPQVPDVLYFNFGLHNLGNSTVPGQAGPIAEYAPYLEKIAAKLAALALAQPRMKLLFGITTPEMCDKGLDDTVVANNIDAAKIMARHGIPTVDMHTPIVAQCGPSPQPKCFNQSQCFCPHCPMNDGVGYEFLAKEVIAPRIRALL